MRCMESHRRMSSRSTEAQHSPAINSHKWQAGGVHRGGLTEEVSSVRRGSELSKKGQEL
jgi:hypothetical protein